MMAFDAEYSTESTRPSSDGTEFYEKIHVEAEPDPPAAPTIESSDAF